jgi:hypothetical protein
MAAMRNIITISRVSVASKMLLNFQASLTNIFVAFLCFPMWMPGCHHEMVTTAAPPRSSTYVTQFVSSMCMFFPVSGLLNLLQA